MKPSFDNASPIFEQIAEAIRRDIVAGVRAPGSRVEPVRELALALGVNPNTLQRALQQLESEGLLYTERTSGRFVTGDVDAIARLRERQCRKLAGSFLAAMADMGFSRGEVLQLIATMDEDVTQA